MISLYGKRYCPTCTIIVRGDWDYGVMGYTKHSEKPVWLIRKEGRFGSFFGCPNFPKCNYSESLPKPKQLNNWDDELRPY